MRDLHSGLLAATMLAAASLAATPVPIELDMQGYSSAEIVLSIGAGGITFDDTNKVDFVLEHSDDGANWDAVTTGDVLGVAGDGTITDGIIKALTAEHAAAGTYRFGYIGGRRHVRLKPTFAGTHGTATPLAATLILGHPASEPVADQA